MSNSPWTRRVRVPGDVGLDRVEAHQPRLADAVRPLVRVHPEVVDRTGEDAVRLAVEQEVVLADGRSGHGQEILVVDMGGRSGSRAGARRPDRPVSYLAVTVKPCWLPYSTSCVLPGLRGRRSGRCWTRRTGRRCRRRCCSRTPGTAGTAIPGRRSWRPRRAPR